MKSSGWHFVLGKKSDGFISFQGAGTREGSLEIRKTAHRYSELLPSVTPQLFQKGQKGPMPREGHDIVSDCGVLMSMDVRNFGLKTPSQGVLASLLPNPTSKKTLNTERKNVVLTPGVQKIVSGIKKGVAEGGIRNFTSM